MATPNRVLLDDTDRGMIDALLEDGRMSFRGIGERIGLAGDATRDRYNRLRDLGVIRVVGVPNPSSLGFRSAATVGISVAGPVGPVAQALLKVPNVTLVTTTFGTFDILFEIIATGDQALFDALDEHVRSLPGIAKCNAFLYGHIYKWGTGTGWPRSRPTEEGHDLTSEDRLLISALQADGRASFAELAEQSGLSYAQVRRRTKMLLDANIVEINTAINRPVLGTAVMAAIVVRVSGVPLAKVARDLASIASVEIVIQTLGTFDLLVEVACKDHAGLHQLINDHIWPIEGISATETFLYVKLERLPVQWGAAALMDAMQVG
jgi:DNA-binding Lrp family transcriptional regulator